MSCTKVNERLEAHVDGMLSAAERADVEGHLAGCADCAARARGLRALEDLLGASPSLPPPPGFEASFLKRLRAEPSPRAPLWERIFGGWRTLALAGAAAVVVVVAVWPARDGTRVGVPEPGERAAIATEPELLRRMELLRNLDVAKHLEAVEGLTDEELEAVSQMPGLGG